ncbi:alpha/beta fold hydrolase [Streptomyces sp. NPDC001515]
MLTALVAATAAALLAAPAAGILGHRQIRRAAEAAKLRITTPHGIDEAGFVRIGGLDQWISVRGDDRANPVVLEIHGGPGASNHVFLPRTRGWERHFTVVRWDMRGAGRTFARHGAGGQGPFTLDRLYEDALEVTDHVRERLGVEKVLLVANSFGTVTGLRLARAHPERYTAYVGTDQNIMAGGREHGAHRALLERLEKAGKRKDLAAATAMGSDPSAWTPQQSSRYAKLVITSDPLSYDTMKTVVVRSLWFSPLHSLRGLRSYMAAMTFSERVAHEAAGIDERAEGTVFRLPVFLFQGAHDVLTPPGPARAFLDDVTAPVKDFALIEDASHFAAFRHPDRFLELMLTRVRPVIGADRTEA